MNKAVPATRDLVVSVMQFLEPLSTHEPGGSKAVRDFFHRQSTAWQPCSISASGLQGKKCGQEYLLDLTISEDLADARDDDPFGYRSLLLAVEVEWSPRRYDRRYDFCKLADVKAKRKVFIGACHGKEWPETDAEVSAMQAFIDGHELVGAEEFGVVLCSYGPREEMLGWVLRKGAKPEQIGLE